MYAMERRLDRIRVTLALRVENLLKPAAPRLDPDHAALLGIPI